VYDVSFLKNGVWSGQEWHPVSSDETDSASGRDFECRRRMAEPALAGAKFSENHVTAWIAVFLCCPGGEEATKHLAGGPRNRGDGGNTESLVYLCTPEVINACDNSFNTVRFACHSSRDDVRVVTAAHRREGMSALDTRAFQGLPIKAHPGDSASVETLAKSPERLCLLVNDCNRVATLIKFLSEEGANATASEDDDVHTRNATPPAPFA
jgi:hypothetical protein